MTSDERAVLVGQNIGLALTLLGSIADGSMAIRDVQRVAIEVRDWLAAALGASPRTAELLTSPG